MHSFLNVESLGEARCRKSWNQFKGYDSLSIRYVKRVSRERKDHRLGKINVKVPHQRSPYAMKFEDQSHEETERPTLSCSLILHSNGQIYISSSDPRPPADSKGVPLVGRAWRKPKSWTGPTDCALASAKLDEALRRPRNSTMNGWSCMRQRGKTCTTCEQPSRADDR